MVDLVKMAVAAMVPVNDVVTDGVTDERMTELAFRMRVREATDLLAWFKREAYKDHTL